MMKLYYKRAECFLDQFNKYYGVTEPIYEDATPDVMYDRLVSSKHFDFINDLGKKKFFF